MVTFRHAQAGCWVLVQPLDAVLLDNDQKDPTVVEAVFGRVLRKSAELARAGPCPAILHVCQERPHGEALPPNSVTTSKQRSSRSLPPRRNGQEAEKFADVLGRARGKSPHRVGTSRW